MQRNVEKSKPIDDLKTVKVVAKTNGRRLIDLVDSLEIEAKL